MFSCILSGQKKDMFHGVCCFNEMRLPLPRDENCPSCCRYTSFMNGTRNIYINHHVGVVQMWDSGHSGECNENIRGCRDLERLTLVS